VLLRDKWEKQVRPRLICRIDLPEMGEMGVRPRLICPIDLPADRWW
jgi:hypothetical protein